ncbi:Cof-type HAD-IIB family hydrolase [Eupransor demetentiae]|uniref:Hydroxymethylpyrimidine pyrophosphatase and other HAD family phosphatases (Cof) n=1 Tax=Eupransor demetentiae TaxID=3109584 RepID=A0ABP0EN32_9LACO|nr:Hydroxymethylpyrimidine pyrophosphatase and other HAD family phosphatases (Cof) [Lactobacillaceae bacterium LMG 33000]
MSVKLIATDLDATFLHDDKSFNAPLLARVLPKLKEKGIHFVIATGNHPDRVQDFFKDFAGQYALIANNGAEIFAGGQLLEVRGINPQSFAKINEIAQTFASQMRLGLIFTGSKKAYLLDNQEQLAESILTAKAYFNQVQVIHSLAEIQEPILKITTNIAGNSEQFIDQIQAALGDLVHVTTSGYGSVDIVNPQVNKAEGLAHLGQHWQIEASEMMAFGDGCNDIEMLDYVGKPFMMPNSDERLFDRGYSAALANNNRDGVLKTICDYLDLH